MSNKEQNPQSTKPRVISSCDCFIGFLCGERIEKSTIEFEVKSLSKMQLEYKKYGILKGEPQTPKQIVDGRKGYLSRFSYCPYEEKREYSRF